MRNDAHLTTRKRRLELVNNQCVEFRDATLWLNMDGETLTPKMTLWHIHIDELQDELAAYKPFVDALRGGGLEPHWVIEVPER